MNVMAERYTRLMVFGGVSPSEACVFIFVGVWCVCVCVCVCVLARARLRVRVRHTKRERGGSEIYRMVCAGDSEKQEPGAPQKTVGADPPIKARRISIL